MNRRLCSSDTPNQSTLKGILPSTSNSVWHCIGHVPTHVSCKQPHPAELGTRCVTPGHILSFEVYNSFNFYSITNKHKSAYIMKRKRSASHKHSEETLRSKTVHFLYFYLLSEKLNISVDSEKENSCLVFIF